MRTVNKIWKLFEKWLPYLWGLLMFLIITGGLGGLLILIVKWIFGLLGVL